MNKMTKNSAPEGYSSVCPYLMVESVEIQLQFLKAVFDAEVTEELNQQNGEVMHGQARIGDTTVMMGKSREEYGTRESMNYVFVDDVDETYNKAIEQGATSLMEPIDQFYGNREAGLKDPQGNQWWIAKQIEKLSPEELQERMKKEM